MSKSSLSYLIQIFLFVIILTYIVDKVIYLSINQISKQVYTGQTVGKLNHYLKQKDDLNFIVFGSSRANHHIDPVKIETKSFNMGMDGTKIVYSNTLIKLLPKNKKQTVLLHISPKNSVSTNYKGEDVINLSTLFHQQDIVKNEIKKYNQNKLIQDIFWCQIYNNSALGIIKNYFIPNYNYKSYFGFDPIFVSEEQHKIFNLVLDKWEPQNCNQTFKLNQVYMSSLKELKKFCEENNKTLILYTSPIYRDDCKEDDLKLSEFLEKEGFNYWNYSDYFKNDNSLVNWKDNTHLSNIGAEIFTQEIKNRLNRMN